MMLKIKTLKEKSTNINKNLFNLFQKLKFCIPISLQPNYVNL